MPPGRSIPHLRRHAVQALLHVVANNVLSLLMFASLALIRTLLLATVAVATVQRTHRRGKSARLRLQNVFFFVFSLFLNCVPVRLEPFGCRSNVTFPSPGADIFFRRLVFCFFVICENPETFRNCAQLNILTMLFFVQFIVLNQLTTVASQDTEDLNRQRLEFFSFFLVFF